MKIRTKIEKYLNDFEESIRNDEFLNRDKPSEEIKKKRDKIISLVTTLAFESNKQK